MSMHLNNCDDKTLLLQENIGEVFLQSLISGVHVLRKETADSLCIPGFGLKLLLYQVLKHLKFLKFQQHPGVDGERGYQSICK